MANHNLTNAKKAKNDEFYTQLQDICDEVYSYIEFNKNLFRGKTVLCPCDDPAVSKFTRLFFLKFEEFGIKKLISTCMIPGAQGRVSVITSPTDNYETSWTLLEGDGDFRSPEVTALRDEADFIITNPPFSLFREFVAWIMEAKKKFLVIGNLNAITYKEIFPLIKNNLIWLGLRSPKEFRIPDHYPMTSPTCRVEDGIKYVTLGNVQWYTNVTHGRRKTPMSLMSYADVERFGLKAKIQKYDNYDAIEIPKTKFIPSDYPGAIGVPISFLERYCPDQFEILWQASGNTRASAPKQILTEVGYIKHDADRGGCAIVSGERVYSRFLIRHIKPK